MRIPSFVLTLMAALLILTGSSSAQTPAATPASGPLMQATLDQTAPDNLATIGITRTIFETGGTLRVVTGTGPAISWVESGEVTLVPDAEAPQPIIVRADATPDSGTNGSEFVVVEGDGFVLAPGTTATLRNNGPEPAVVLDLVSAPDTVRELGDGVSQVVVMSTEATLPAAPVLVTFSLVTLDPGGHLTLPPEPAVSIYAAVDKSKIIQVSGNGFNRATEPIDVYILTIAPA